MNFFFLEILMNALVYFTSLQILVNKKKNKKSMLFFFYLTNI